MTLNQLLRRLSIGALVCMAAIPGALAAQDDPEEPEEPAERPPLPDPGWKTWTSHGCFATPFGPECHQVTMAGHVSFSHWYDGYAWYWWEPFTATWTGVLREPTEYLMVEYMSHDGDMYHGAFHEISWGWGTSHVGAYQWTFNHGQTMAREPEYYWQIRAYGVDLEERGRATLVAGPMPQATVPEPATLALTATGMLGLGVAARRRRGGRPAR